MHAMGLHSALAIKRQRKRREEQRRARERRFSTQSTESGLTSPHNSIASLDRQRGARRTAAHSKATGDAVGSKVVTSVGMMHIGVVFLVLGAFLLVSGLLPTDLTSWSTLPGGAWFNELSITGAFALFIGVFLVVLNRIISKREEDVLNEYVQRQLTRSRSGHRLVRDVETGCLTTRAQQRPRTTEESAASTPDPEAVEPAPLHLPAGGGLLEQIAEEEPLPALAPYCEKGEDEARGRHGKDVCSNGSTTGGSLSPGSPSETQELLSARARFLNICKRLSVPQQQENNDCYWLLVVLL
ncbi:uncharacterized protein LOC124775560 [Schistocerca piceifrons]|uniref:uncharacterized protein LOC124775560 n=1 Tax=Schistocerca piceifrons TaxID=274613 RepID=UPI001F5E4D06|nr:uncharacterized protein LOC124775560 [Schistocerca piceifrons]